MEQSSTLSQLKDIISKTLLIEKNEINEEVGPGDLPQWDSLGHQSLLLAIEKHFGVSFVIDEVLDMETVEDIVDAIDGKTKQ